MSIGSQICDIPYGINVGNMAYLNETKKTITQKNGSKTMVKSKVIYDKMDWDMSIPGQEYFDELCRISKNQIIFGVEYVDWEGLESGRIKWDKGVSDGVSFKKYELAYCSSINYTYDLQLLWTGMCQAKSLKEPMTQKGNKKLNEKRIHPCHKPVMLYDKIIQEFIPAGSRCLDTHGGGMSIAISCDKSDIDLDICEINEKYFNAGVNRYNNYKRQLTLF